MLRLKLYNSGSCALARGLKLMGKGFSNNGKLVTTTETELAPFRRGGL